MCYNTQVPSYNSATQGKKPPSIQIYPHGVFLFMWYNFKQGMAKPAHRPSLYSEELAEEVCNRISSGQTMRIIDQDPSMPCAKTVYNWLLEHKEFLQKYAKAKSDQAELMFDELIEIADSPKVDLGQVNRDRLRVDTRKWYLSKVLPKKYGDKLDLTTGGKELPTPILGVVVDNQPVKQINGI